MVLLGAAAGATIFAGLPVARMGWLPRKAQGFLNAIATGIVVFLLWDILTHAVEPVTAALTGLHRGSPGQFVLLAVLFAVGIGGGLLALVHLNGWLVRLLTTSPDTGRLSPAKSGEYRRSREGAEPGEGPRSPAKSGEYPAEGRGREVRGVATIPPRALSMMLATGLGLHNLSEGLAIGQSAASGAAAFAGVLIVGFALHNVTEGFGIAAPLTLDAGRTSWGFLFVAGLIGGGPTFLGTLIGYRATSTYVYVLFLALAAGALLYVLNELFALNRRLNSPSLLAWGLLTGFLAALSTDLLLTYLAF